MKRMIRNPGKWHRKRSKGENFTLRMPQPVSGSDGRDTVVLI